MNKIVKANDKTYEIINNNREAFNEEEFLQRCTDYFIEFDYIVGDYSYGKLRLKGFFDEKNPKVKEFNNIKNLEKYLHDYCAFGCKYYVAKRNNM